jgi:hypothetical protein
MHEELWAGPDLKLRYAEFHLQKSADSIIDTGWQRSFYPHLDAFLSTIPEIIQCCFGVDDGNREMREWFSKLSPDEQARRREFKRQFDNDYRGFRSRRLSDERHNIEHRTGVAQATVTIKGAFGDTHKGSPTQLVPTAETGQIDIP